MTRRIKLLVIIAAGALVLLTGFSCLDPDEKKPVTNAPPPPPPTYQDLTQKDHVLNNLKLSYNERNYARYAELLADPHFTYFFSPEDFAAGVTPEQWGRAADIDCHQHMFNPNTPVNKVLTIKLALQYPAGQWAATTPDQDQFPGETWYFKTVTYDLTVMIEAHPENITYQARGMKAMFTLRQIKQIWQIVEWRDDVETTATGAPAQIAASGIKEISWGRVKSLYGK